MFFNKRINIAFKFFPSECQNSQETHRLLKSQYIRTDAIYINTYIYIYIYIYVIYVYMHRWRETLCSKICKFWIINFTNITLSTGSYIQ